jgi:prevent-host-death family protein
MSQAEWSLQDAKNKFSAVVEAASKGAPQIVTKRGKPAVVVVAVEEYERLTDKGKERPSFIEHLLSAPKGPFKLTRVRLKPRNVKF